MTEFEILEIGFVEGGFFEVMTSELKIFRSEKSSRSIRVWKIFEGEISFFQLDRVSEVQIHSKFEN